jgi:N-acetylglucosaminyldiphosphoundecaprenol N-acetyl-beta-D-mannosaminyltransferase
MKRSQIDQEQSETRSCTPRVDVLGVGVSLVNLDSAVLEICEWIRRGDHHYVCVTGVHGVMESQRDPFLRSIHNRSGLTTPDGMPLVWSARFAGARNVSRVYGPDLMLRMAAESADLGLQWFLYGGKEGVAPRLAERLADRFPGLQVIGWVSPPFGELTAEEDDQIVDRINDAQPDIVWVGLSTPKQEKWMASHVGRINAAALIGVGAAFDIHAGTLRQAPRGVQRCGLEWLFRLMMEPRRLWRRYLRNNPAFILQLIRRPPTLTWPEPEGQRAS